jgi:hypothetical protein
MKRRTTDSKNYGALRTFDDFLRIQGLPLSNATKDEEFLKAISETLRNHRANEALLHGFRAQTMFAYVAASLGACKIITEEDSGEFYVSDDDFKRPDFRILTTAGHEFFVEAKNFYQGQNSDLAPYTLKAGYVDNLRRYAEAFQKPVFIAIYWSRWGTWTLNPLTDFTFDQGVYSIVLTEAGKNDHKYLLGDYLMGIRKPLVLRIYTNPSEPRTLRPGKETPFTIGKAVLLAGGEEIVDPFENQLAWFFWRYVPWQDVEQPVHVEGDQVIYFDVRGVLEDANPDQPFLIVGPLSSLISRQFDTLTTGQGSVLRLTPRVDPDKLGIVIPPGFTGTVLHLWRFDILPDNRVFPRNA